MSFQWIFNNAESLSIDRQQITGQTITRNQTVRTSSRGGGIWKFTVKLPDGLRWTDIRSDITKAERLGMVTPNTVQIGNGNGMSYITKYLGNAVGQTGWTTTIASGASTNTFTLTSNSSISSGQKLRAGDIIQMGNSGAAYTVAVDVPYTSNTVTVDRIIDEPAGSYVLNIGQNVIWDIVCINFPSWTLVDYDRVAWSGPFVFYENRV